MFSIIIPTYNESEHIANTINKIYASNLEYEIELIVVDGGSTDETVKIATTCGARAILCERKGRAAQMNVGATMSKYEFLYFIHADSIPPHDFTTLLNNAFNKGVGSGCFRLAFDRKHWFLQANAWFTRFNVNAVRFGDQSLFATKDIFEKAGGFREDLLVMEDQEIIHRLKRHGKFKVLDDVVVTSSRKYIDNGIFRMQGIFFVLWAMYYLGYSQIKILKLYRKLIK